MTPGNLQPCSARSTSGMTSLFTPRRSLRRWQCAATRPGTGQAPSASGRVLPSAASQASQEAATAASSSSSSAISANQLPSLKEWAPACAALGAGGQTVLLRKGGIREPAFRPAAREFLLFPTAFHTDAQLLKPEAAAKYAQEVHYDPKAQPELEFSVLARATGAWTAFDPRVLQLLDGLHIWGPEFLEARLKWRERQPITVLELRAYRLQQPLRVAAEEGFWGCFSWVDVPLPPSLAPGKLVATATPALTDAEFAARQQECRRQLAQIEVQELELPPTAFP